MRIIQFGFITAIALLFGCKQPEQKVVNEEKPVELSEAFKQKWFVGQAEITSFDLQQARYGEMRNGTAVQIFVSEDFSANKLVKLDDPNSTPEKATVLKMNFTKKFNTGIYPYSMMVSSFVPVNITANGHPLKVSCTSQEWCGHTFSQIENKGGKYDYTLHSYFEKEGEQKSTHEATFTEDEMWNRIRINPENMPHGKIKIIPGLFYLRLSHKAFAATDAIANLQKTDSISSYSIEFSEHQRKLVIHFKSAFPHEILGWEESYPDGFGSEKKMLTTIAKKKKTIWLDYWKRNSNADSFYRDSLQLN